MFLTPCMASQCYSLCVCMHGLTIKRLSIWVAWKYNTNNKLSIYFNFIMYMETVSDNTTSGLFFVAAEYNFEHAYND